MYEWVLVRVGKGKGTGGLGDLSTPHAWDGKGAVIVAGWGWVGLGWEMGGIDGDLYSVWRGG